MLESLFVKHFPLHTWNCACLLAHVCMDGLCAELVSVSQDFKKWKNNMEQESEKSLSKAETGVLSTGGKAHFYQAGHGSDFQH